jgi:ATPase subunit of ABC transporter with duplicated ATPase domains
VITVSNLSLQYGGRVLFERVNLKLTMGNCYGVIGANGAGKTTFLKILSGEISSNSGDISITQGQRMSILKQNQFEYDDKKVIDTVMLGNEKLFEIMKEKDDLYAKEDFSDEDGIRASELEAEFAEMDGWEAESNASSMLQGLGIDTDSHQKLMEELSGGEKIKVLLAQALFGKPDILLLDEPTNNLDIASVNWLEEFLINFDGIVVVVSHDRHFLNQVCTHMADIDFKKIKLYVGNYDFWYQSSQLMLQLSRDQNKKKEERVKELEDFIRRFSANASKSKQATSRKKSLEKIVIESIEPSTRKYPFVGFKAEREVGNEIITVENLSKTIDGVQVLKDVSFSISKDDKICFLGTDTAVTTLFKILEGEIEPDSGKYKWGITITNSFFPKENSKYFDNVELDLINWLRQFSEDKTESYIRGFLGRMLFSGEESLKSANVLSGGEKVRCMLSKMMLSNANVLVLDQPTNHLDLESITALNNGLVDYKSNILFSSHDHEFIQTIANRIIRIEESGTTDKKIPFDEFIKTY